MATTLDTIDHTETEKLLRSLPAGARIGRDIGGSAGFNASCYEPNDALRGVHCFGSGATLDVAITAMLAKVEQAKAQGKRLSTAAECKAEVIRLIGEYDAAPASFRHAVDALQVR